MKTEHRYTTLAMIVCFSMLLLACQEASDKRRMDNNPGVAPVAVEHQLSPVERETATRDSMVIFRSDGYVRVSENEQYIAVYKSSMTDSNGLLDALYDVTIDSLEQQNNNLEAKLDVMEDDGKYSWVGLKTKFNNDMDKLEKEFKEFVVKAKVLLKVKS